MIMFILLYFLWYFFIFAPIVMMLHEFGHVIAIKVFGGRIFEIHLTGGSPILKIGKIHIGKFFYGGKVEWDGNSISPKYQRVIIELGGVIMTGVLSVIFTLFLFSKSLSFCIQWISKIFEAPFWIVEGGFWCIGFVLIVATLAPLFPYNDKTDGAKLLKLLRQ